MNSRGLFLMGCEVPWLVTVACDMFVAVVVPSDSDSTVDWRDSEPELRKGQRKQQVYYKHFRIFTSSVTGREYNVYATKQLAVFLWVGSSSFLTRLTA